MYRRRKTGTKTVSSSSNANLAEAAAETTETGFSAWAAMQDILDKLAIVGGWEEFAAGHKLPPLTPTTFVAPASTPAEQLWTFTCLVSYLLGVNGQHFPPPAQFDDPTATVTSIVVEVKKFGVTASFPDHKLRIGYGDAVCQVLNSLLDATLKYKGFKVAPVALQASNDDDELADEELPEDEGDEYADLGAQDFDEAYDSDGSEEEYYMGGDYAGGANTDGGDAGVDDGGDGGYKGLVRDDSGILKTRVDPAAWRLELERVRPALRVTIHTDNKEWRTHFDQMETHSKAIEKTFVKAKENLGSISGDIRKGLDKISTREKYINSHLASLLQEYQRQQEALKTIEDKYSSSSGTVMKLTNDLAAISDELEAIKQQLDEKGSTVADNQPLVKIKGALGKLKKEIAEMDIRIGTLQHVLLTSRMRSLEATNNSHHQNHNGGSFGHHDGFRTAALAM